MHKMGFTKVINSWTMEVDGGTIGTHDGEANKVAQIKTMLNQMLKNEWTWFPTTHLKIEALFIPLLKGRL